MHAIILAAGMGTRLGGSTPKPLVEIAHGRTLLDQQLRLLSPFMALEQVILVVGHEAGLIISGNPHVRHVVNTRYATTNTAVSLRLGLAGIDDDVLWMNGDLYAERAAIERILGAAERGGAALVDRSTPGREPVKYRLHADGFIAEISKHVRGGEGESLGLHVAPRAEIPALRGALEQCRDDDFFEAALERCARAGTMRIRPVEVPPGAFCREVDYPDDLEAVRRRAATQANA